MNAIVIGSQFGDGGKGGIVDLFSKDADVVARYQGGDNAGHTAIHWYDSRSMLFQPMPIINDVIVSFADRDSTFTEMLDFAWSHGVCALRWISIQ